MKKIFLLPLMLGGVVLTSCQDEDFGYESNAIAYEKTMTQMLGQVDANQTWVNAELNYVTVQEDCRTVKVFDGLTGKVIADYQNVKAGEKVYYNATIGYEVTVSNGVAAMPVANGETVSFASEGPSQVSVVYGNTDTSISSFKGRDGYINFKSNFIEKDFHRYGIGDENIRKKVEFVATNATEEDGTSTFVMYPAYWDCEEHLTVGIYYYNPATGEMVVDETPVYENRNNTVLFGNASGATQLASSWVCVGDVTCSELRTQTGSGRLTQWDVFPIYVTVPKNMVFGFWIKGDSDKIYYGNPSLNDNCENEDCSHSGVFDPNVLETYYRPFYTLDEERAGEPKPIYLGMSANNHKDVKGYYDIYFVLKAVKDINYELSSYTLAFEDLGATGIEDMDFNDCVLRLTCVSGLPVATVSLLAAGGRLPIEVTYDGEMIWDEIHAAFGVDRVPVNANKYHEGVSTDVVSVTALPTKSIELTGENQDIKTLVAKFGLTVTRGDGKYDKIGIPVNPGQYPLGFAVAGDFAWPGEQQNIVGTYPDFATWASNSGYSYWYPWSSAE